MAIKDYLRNLQWYFEVDYDCNHEFHSHKIDQVWITSVDYPLTLTKCIQHLRDTEKKFGLTPLPQEYYEAVFENFKLAQIESWEIDVYLGYYGEENIEVHLKCFDELIDDLEKLMTGKVRFYIWFMKTEQYKAHKRAMEIVKAMSPEEQRQTLIASGIINNKGELTTHFGGTGEPDVF